jgi:hypothetical protein
MVVISKNKASLYTKKRRAGKYTGENLVGASSGIGLLIYIDTIKRIIKPGSPIF